MSCVIAEVKKAPKNTATYESKPKAAPVRAQPAKQTEYASSKNTTQNGYDYGNEADLTDEGARTNEGDPLMVEPAYI